MLTNLKCGIGDIVVDTQWVVASFNVSITTIPPSGSPTVSNDPIVNTLNSSPSNQDDGMIGISIIVGNTSKDTISVS